jgi:hypothetical protein
MRTRGEMESDVDRVHHVVWCVRGENLERVRAYWDEGLGSTMVDEARPDARGLGLSLQELTEEATAPPAA